MKPFFPRNPLLRHASAFTAALVAVLLVHSAVETRALRRLASPDSSRYHYGYTDIPHAAADLRAALAARRPVVILGSCELTHEEKVPVLAHRFLPERLGVPVFSLGHGGAGPLEIAAQLAGAAPQGGLHGVPLVILLSPENFSVDEDGSAPFRFLEFFPLELLTRYHFASGVPDGLRHALDAQLALAHGERSEVSATARAIREPGAVAHARAWLRNRVPAELAYRKRLFELAFGNARSGPSPRDATSREGAAAPRWDAWLQEASTEAAARFASHPLGFSAEHAPPFPRPLSSPQLHGRTMEHLQLLIGYLRATQARPLFILQAFHPQAYVGVERYREVAARIAELTTQAGFSFVDLTRERLRPGLFIGPQYMGSYGWMLMNRAIHDHYLAVTGGI